jgi:putative ABC transport system permease protein
MLRSKKGFTLLEVLVSAAVFLIIAIALYRTYASLFALTSVTQFKILALNAANEQFEIIRNLPYADVGEVNGIPNGKIPHSQTLVRGGVTFTITTNIRNVDLPFDGKLGGNPNDLSPADNKLAEVRIDCSTCKNYVPITLTTTISPKNLETASTNGALFIKVFDANGLAVSGATVRVVNTKVTPNIVVQDETDVNGMLQIVDVPPGVQAYSITVSKAGYSTARTYPPGGVVNGYLNPTPTQPDATVVIQQVTQASFAIDRVSTLTFKSVSPVCAPIGGLDFNLSGSKTVGVSIPKFITNLVTDGAGTIGQERATYGSVGKRISLFGTGPDVALVDQNLKLASGRFFTDQEDVSLAQVAVLGSDIKETFFGSSDAVGQYISLRGEKYRVIGVLEPRGAVAFLNFDTFTYVPVQTLQKKLLGVNYVQFISVKMKDAAREVETVADIVAVLRKRHDISNPDKDDFSVTSTKETQKTFSEVLGSLTILLLALTSISLVVGGVGIMNVMYVSVTERTSEIGLRKAVGATSKSILQQFLFEALIITLLGGIIGILLGVLLTLALGYAFAFFGFPLPLSFSFRSFLLGIGFSTSVGIIFGLAPAYRASELTPMEALRRD